MAEAGLDRGVSLVDVSIGADPNGYRGEFLSLVDRAIKMRSLEQNAKP